MDQRTTSHSVNSIALLATGDEICNGDIINSNAPEIARRLFAAGMQVDTHMVVADQRDAIKQAMEFLLKKHRALIITGGLGPTSDDLTRFALSDVLDKPLKFNDKIWEEIVSRLKRFGYLTPPESNRQQALFPEDATVLQNANGTAAGCAAEYNGQLIFMLPGPPAECLPMLHEYVLPRLKAAGFQHINYHKNWLLFGVSEGEMAEKLDDLAKPYACTTGYRICHPYLEFKLHSNQAADFNALLPLIENKIAPYIVADGQKTASELLKQTLRTLKQPLLICDLATGGLLESTLVSPENQPFLQFTTDETKEVHVLIKGLAEFWQKKETLLTHLTMVFKGDKSLQMDLPFRGERVRVYAMELICWKILRELFWRD